MYTQLQMLKTLSSKYLNIVGFHKSTLVSLCEAAIICIFFSHKCSKTKPKCLCSSCLLFVDSDSQMQPQAYLLHHCFHTRWELSTLINICAWGCRKVYGNKQISFIPIWGLAKPCLGKFGILITFCHFGTLLLWRKKKSSVYAHNTCLSVYVLV